MRKIILILLAILATAPAAQAGIGAIATFADFEDLGLGARWNLPFPVIGSSVVTGGTYFTDGDYLALDADLHLALRNSRFYPLAGLQIATDLDNSDLNINLGLGTGFNLGQLNLFAEGKAVIGDNDIIAATIGLQF